MSEISNFSGRFSNFSVRFSNFSSDFGTQSRSLVESWPLKVSLFNMVQNNFFSAETKFGVLKQKKQVTSTQSFQATLSSNFCTCLNKNLSLSPKADKQTNGNTETETEVTPNRKLRRNRLKKLGVVGRRASRRNGEIKIPPSTSTSSRAVLSTAIRAAIRRWARIFAVFYSLVKNTQSWLKFISWGSLIRAVM